MKNKKKILILISLVFFINLEKAFSEQFNFEATEIQIKDAGNILLAKNDVKIISDNGIQIIADSFLYNKTSLILIVEGNVEIIDDKNDLKMYGEKFTYDKNNEKIFSEFKVNVLLNDRYKLISNELSYFIKEKIIKSKKKSILTDDLNNIIESDDFNYSITDGIFKTNKLIYKDNMGNKHTIDSAMLNTNNDQIIGKDLEINFNKDTFGNSDNDPRLKGNAIFQKKNRTKITKGVFTTCKKNDSCPPWTMSAEEITHDKLKKTINYKNAVLKVYDNPIFYFPKFFHPDPTVKRQSGFLAPSFTDSTNGGHLSIPYFKVISDNQDLTFKPRFYSSSSILLNSEYRAVTKHSTHIADGGFKNKKSNSEKNNNSQSHFFLNSKFTNLKNGIFEESDIELKIEQVSNDLYLKMNDIKSPIIENTSTLNSFINFNGVNEDLYFQGNLEVFEDTTKTDSNKYEYVFPNIKIDKTFNLDNNDYLSFDSAGYMKQFDKNVKETSVVNNLNYKSNQFYGTSGLVGDYSLNLKNINTELKNSKKLKNESKMELLTAGMFTAKYPLSQIDKKFKRFLTPKIAFRYSPNQYKNDQNADKRIDINNVFSLNRLGTSEEGASITIGSDYVISDKKDNEDIFKFSLASVFRGKENKNLPFKSTLGNKSSNIFGNMEFVPSKYFNIKYNFSLDNNLDRSTYDQIVAEVSVNNFVNSFQFLEETGPLGNQGYWENKTTLNLNTHSSFSLNKRRNTKTNLNEFYNLIYEYKNDCLTAAVEYNKKFYSDGILKPSEELFFSLTIVPLTRINSANLNK